MEGGTKVCRYYHQGRKKIGCVEPITRPREESGYGPERPTFFKRFVLKGSWPSNIGATVLPICDQNAARIALTDRKRLTMVTCWPYSSNTRLLIVLAFPLP